MTNALLVFPLAELPGACGVLGPKEAWHWSRCMVAVCHGRLLSLWR